MENLLNMAIAGKIEDFKSGIKEILNAKLQAQKEEIKREVGSSFCKKG